MYILTVLPLLESENTKPILGNLLWPTFCIMYTLCIKYMYNTCTFILSTEFFGMASNAFLFIIGPRHCSVSHSHESWHFLLLVLWATWSFHQEKLWLWEKLRPDTCPGWLMQSDIWYEISWHYLHSCCLHFRQVKFPSYWTLKAEQSQHVILDIYKD